MLHVHRFGSGEGRHFFGIHGWGGGWQTYVPLEPSIPEDASIWSVDLPGYGDSPPLATWHYERLAEQVAETVAQLDLPNLHLIGNCSGAAFGLSAALLDPERYDSLFLIDPFAYCPWYFRLLLARGLGRFFYATAFENPVGRWITNQGLADHRTDDSDLTQSFEELDHGVVYEHLRMLSQIPNHEIFAGLKMPIRIAYGQNTFEAVRQSVSMWESIWPQADTVEITGAGHLPIEEATSELAAAVFGWAGSQSIVE